MRQEREWALGDWIAVVALDIRPNSEAEIYSRPFVEPHAFVRFQGPNSAKSSESPSLSRNSRPYWVLTQLLHRVPFSQTVKMQAPVVVMSKPTLFIQQNEI
jgi:hypothetical protein